LGAVGLSLGGTVLLNALLGHGQSESPLLDGVVCISSPLDLQSCAACIERPRNRVYQAWLVRRLIQQTLADPHGLPAQEQQGLRGRSRPRTIRAFDALITAPRWDFPSVLAYYQACSPLPRLRQGLVGPAALPRLLLVQARDDPWVPVEPLLSISEEIRVQREHGSREVWPDVLITDRGGHNGFHASGDSPDGCWSDRLAAHWLQRVLVQPASP
jgi:predicted alpha/beta-fold hydrolase